MREIKLPFYAHLCLVLLSIILTLFLLQIGSVVFIPLLFALLIAVCLYPLAKGLEYRGLPRSLAALISMLIFLGVAGSFIYFLIVQLIDFSQDFPQFQKRILALLSELQTFITNRYHVKAADQLAYLNKSADGMLQSLANSLSSIFTSTLEVVVWTIFVLIYTYFILFHRRLLYRFVMSLFKADKHPEVTEVIDNTRSIINHYILGLLLEIAILTVVNSAAFAIIGIKYALFLGMLAAVLNIIPYLGIYTAIVICTLVTFANGTLGQATSVGVALIILHFIDANILMPRIVGSRVKMNALITILAVITGNLVWGISGMLLFIPLVAIMKIIFERVEGMQPWAILIGAEEKVERKREKPVKR